MAGSLRISTSDLETGVYQRGSVNTEPAILAVAGLTAGGSGSQSTATTSGSSGTGTKSHHHE